MKAVWTCENAGIGLLTQQAHYENSPASLISAFSFQLFLPTLLPIVQRRHRDFGVFRVDVMHETRQNQRAPWG